MITVWIIAAVVFLIVEIVSAALCSLWFVVGSVAALIVAALGCSPVLQVVVFLAVSALCFWLLYPRMKQLLWRNRQPTNADMVIGQECVVTQRIDNLAGTGTVSVGGKIWTARTADGQTVEPGAIVVAGSIQGVKLIVTPVKTPEAAQL